MPDIAWIPVLFVALLIVPAVLRLDAHADAPFRSFRERMASFARGRR